MARRLVRVVVTDAEWGVRAPQGHRPGRLPTPCVIKTSSFASFDGSCSEAEECN